MKTTIDWKLIVRELYHHVPFTAIGALTGIIFIVVITSCGYLDDVTPHAKGVFYVLHPTHVFLSAMVTTALYRIYGNGKYKIAKAILIGYTGSIFIATLSDCIIPYLGEALTVLPGRELEIGFIHEPIKTNPPALAGIAVGYLLPTTRFPHAGHVLISTWASLFHILMAVGTGLEWWKFVAIFAFLFIAVWLPCCLSDIVYPLLFVKHGEAPEHHHH
jgi:hypothetical protein